MGAEGGVCWVRAKDPEVFQNLVKPFGFLRFDEREANWEFDFEEEFGSSYAHDDYVYATWDDLGSVLNFFDLEEILSWSDDLKDPTPEHHSYGLAGFYDFTFDELCEDFQTRIDSLYHPLVWRQFQEKLVSMQKGPFPLPSFWSWTFGEWSAKVSASIRRQSFGRVTTWT